MQEIWKDIEGYKGIYQVSNYGRVRSLKYAKESVLKAGTTGKGYYNVILYKNNISKNFLVHRLLALHFIPNPENKPQINHCDGNKLNNHIDNLEWNTCKENIHHAFDTRLSIVVKGEKHYKSKLTEEQVLEIRTSNLTQVELGKIYNVSKGLISLIKNNKTWKHI